ncbi:MAG: hypothetical protein GWM92_07585 [Gemmatimonadetes bacterium]|nr:hypothetical protein [Gemmatimonadota bacterium]NIR77928.1 hypothetical protein [Gemmatimonadota bacterium]NIT87094.1 hypothetical protein [Gemmatimonadota bacterium]NIU30936.1 hypothetical protein [Gemmatimonadota bacterium]NIU35211.1 hypothetical protein [Gemmatimonadota bacterium]
MVYRRWSGRGTAVLVVPLLLLGADGAEAQSGRARDGEELTAEVGLDILLVEAATGIIRDVIENVLD